MKNKRFLGIDLGGTNIKYGLYDNTGNCLDGGGIFKTACDDLDALLQKINEAVQKYNNLDGIGLSVPGCINKETGVLFEGGALKSLDGVDLKSILARKYSIPIAMENDANCAILAEQWLGNGKGLSNFVCITIGTGIGGSLVLNGKLHNGHRNYAGEFGYMRIPISDRTNDRASESYGNTSTYMLLNSASDQGFSLTGAEFFDRLDEGEEPIEQIYKDWINNLAMGIYNIAVIVDPERVLIGGGISAQERIYADITKSLDDIIKDAAYLCGIEVMPCRFRNDAGKIGAIYQLI